MRYRNLDNPAMQPRVLSAMRIALALLFLQGGTGKRAGGRRRSRRVPAVSARDRSGGKSLRSPERLKERFQDQDKLLQIRIRHGNPEAAVDELVAAVGELS